MGRGHVNYAGTRLVAVCDVDKKHLELGKQLVKEKIAAYHDFRDLILDPNVDIVHIATPPHWHGIMSVEAAKAGKDIWCEKPMTRTIGEGKRVMEAVKQNGRMFRLNSRYNAVPYLPIRRRHNPSIRGKYREHGVHYKVYKEPDLTTCHNPVRKELFAVRDILYLPSRTSSRNRYVY